MSKLPSGWKPTTWTHATPMGEGFNGDELRAGLPKVGGFIHAMRRDAAADVTWVCRWAEAPKRVEVPDTCRIIDKPKWFIDDQGRKWATVWLYAAGAFAFMPSMQLVATTQGHDFDYVEPKGAVYVAGLTERHASAPSEASEAAETKKP